MVDEIQKRWDLWSKEPVPKGASDIEISGVDLLSIDTFSAGCISTFVRNRGELDQERVDILRNCVRDLDIVLGQLTGDTKVYFTALSELSHKVLESIK